MASPADSPPIIKKDKMKREVIEFTQAELEALYREMNKARLDWNIVKKFDPSSGGLRVQVDEEEVETILDLLPNPSGISDSNLRSAIEKLQQFLR